MIFGVFRGFFWDKIEFPRQTVKFCLQHIIHILKAIDLTFNFGYLESILEHPATRHCFANTVGLVYKLDRTLHRTTIFKS